MHDAPIDDVSPDDRWWALAEASPVAQAIVRVADRGVLRVNAAFVDLLRIDPDSADALDLLALVHPDDQATAGRALGAVVDAGSPPRWVTVRWVRGDGSELVGDLDLRPVGSEAGGSMRALLTVVDATELARARSVFDGSEVLRTTALRALSDVLLVVDRAGRVTFASLSIDGLLGRPASAVRGRSLTELVHPDDEEAVAALLRAQVAGDSEPRQLACRMLHADGTERSIVASSVNLLDDPVVEGVVLVARVEPRDAVTTAQDALRRRYHQMLAHVADRVSLIDATGNAVEELGPGRKAGMREPARTWSTDESIRRCHPDQRERLIHEFARLFSRAGEELHERFSFADDEGGWMTLEFVGRNCTDDPDLGGTILTSRDVTASEEAARELADARDQALRALAARSEFVATVSHELRTPIHGILGLAELLTDHDDVAVRRTSGLIVRAADSLRLVVDDILDLSKLEAGRLEILPGPIDVAELRGDLVAMFDHQTGAKGIDLVVDVPDGFPGWVWGDALRFRQVLTNLLGNAVKFTERGEVRVTVSTEPAPPGTDVAELVRITVRDSGIGIPADAQRDLFEPFSPAHARTSHRYGGTGLGLVITLKLVEAMSGTLLVESTEGVGSTFTVLFPLAPLATDEHGRPIIPAPALTEREALLTSPSSVLVVEDNPVNQLLVQRQLEVLGYDVAVVVDGETAVASYRSGPPAAVLMDLRLPGIDGIEAARRIRALEAELGWPHTPIVAMTASDLAGDRDEADAAGMDGFLSKPVGLSALRGALTDWCGLAAGAPLDRTDDRPILDLSVPDQLVEELEDPELVAHLCELFVRELPARTTAINQAIGVDDAAVRAASHALRSAALTLGATGLVELCERLDRARPEDRAGVLAPLAQVAQATAQALTSLAARYRDRVR